ncbi:MAG: SGNH/GDSL hydrolase family protein [Candidatus Sumerlaeaceae bacterium]|nr:SGNH/GDSL hydrolase family protein [Candidatus Sumerlaeaceae bacterium]
MDNKLMHSEKNTADSDVVLGLRKKEWLFRIGALGLGVAIACIALEVCVRLLLAARPDDIEALKRFEHARRTSGELKMIHFVRLSSNPRMVYELVPNVSGTFHNAPLRTNSAGFADRERIKEKPAGVFRLAVIGDSIAFGWGVDPSDRYSDVLERFLNDTATSRTRYEVLNFGIPGYNTVMEAALLKERVLAYHPDALVLGYCADNDTSLPNFIRRPRQLFTLSHSYLWEILRNRSLKPARLALEGAVEYSDPSNVPPEYHFLIGWENAKRALEEIAGVCAKEQKPVLFLRDYYYLEPYRGETSATVTDIGQEAENFAREIGFIVVNPLASLLSFVEKQQLHSFALSVAPDKGDAHPNALRHALLARELYRTLVSRQILPDAAERLTNMPRHEEMWDTWIKKALEKSNIPEKYHRVSEPRN